MSNLSDFVGGGASEVNDLKVFSQQDGRDLIITDTGEHWLKTGVQSTAYSTYPDANRWFDTFPPEGTITNVTPAARVNGIVYDGTNWVMSGQGRHITKYSNDLSSVVSTATNILPGNPIGSDITFDPTEGDGFYYVCGPQYSISGYPETVWKLPKDLSSAAVAFTEPSSGVIPNMAMTGIAFDSAAGTLWIADNTSQIIYEFTKAGALTGNYFDSNVTPRNLNFVEGQLWIGGTHYLSMFNPLTGSRSKLLYLPSSNVAKMTLPTVSYMEGLGISSELGLAVFSYGSNTSSTWKLMPMEYVKKIGSKNATYDLDYNRRYVRIK